MPADDEHGDALDPAPSVAFPTPVPMTAHALLASACIGVKTSR